MDQAYPDNPPLLLPSIKSTSSSLSQPNIPLRLIYGIFSAASMPKLSCISSHDRAFQLRLPLYGYSKKVNCNIEHLRAPAQRPSITSKSWRGNGEREAETVAKCSLVSWHQILWPSEAVKGRYSP